MQSTLSQVKPGDTIRLVSGAYYPDRVGIAYGRYRTRWGDYIRVKLPDGTFDTAHNFVNVGIGAYWTPNSPLRARAAKRA